ncbi:hypothetical protein BKX93_05230 [Chromobacterium vaccinii]|uniref:Uncharacterized protein n=1 Tax=Chromobacterium vaccinii TaxID=1108595 RepID=A0A1D9LDW0_9NEIS|nr:hypothetical protein BKX93_05230 [Chromobacterium vaccinii]
MFVRQIFPSTFLAVFKIGERVSVAVFVQGVLADWRGCFALVGALSVMKTRGPAMHASGKVSRSQEQCLIRWTPA